MGTNGVTSNTVARHVFGAGALFRDYDVASTPSAQAAKLIGATVEDTTVLEVEQEFVNIGNTLDGTLGPIKGLEHRTRDTATIKAEVKDISLTELLAQLPGAAAAEVGAVATVTRANDIDSDDYCTNIAWIGDHAYANGAIGFIISNPLGGDGTLSVSPKNKDGAALPIMFKANYDPTDLATAPWTWIWPSSAVVS